MKDPRATLDGCKLLGLIGLVTVVSAAVLRLSVYFFGSSEAYAKLNTPMWIASGLGVLMTIVSFCIIQHVGKNIKKFATYATGELHATARELLDTYKMDFQRELFLMHLPGAARKMLKETWESMGVKLPHINAGPEWDTLKEAMMQLPGSSLSALMCTQPMEARRFMLLQLPIVLHNRVWGSFDEGPPILCEESLDHIIELDMAFRVLDGMMSGVDKEEARKTLAGMFEAYSKTPGSKHGNMSANELFLKAREDAEQQLKQQHAKEEEKRPRNGGLYPGEFGGEF